eukprot:1522825-Pleurochrysis_carterae.AAC.3
MTGQLLDPAHHAIIRIHWRHVYAAMVRLKYDGEAFSQARVKSDIARTFLARILAYQYKKRLCFFRRQHSYSGKYRLPKSAAQQIQSIGDLRLSDGTLTVKAAVIAVIEQQGISCAQLMPDLLSSSSSKSQHGPSSSSSEGTNNDFNNIQFTMPCNFLISGTYLFVTACHVLPPFSLLSSVRLTVTVGDKIRRHCRCLADHMMILPGRHSSWVRSTAALSAAARPRRRPRRERTLLAAKSAFL